MEWFKGFDLIEMKRIQNDIVFNWMSFIWFASICGLRLNVNFGFNFTNLKK